MKQEGRLKKRIEKSDLLNDNRVRWVAIGKVIVFCLLLAVLIVLIVSNRGSYYGVRAWYVNLPISLLILGENAIKFWTAKGNAGKIVCYSVDIISLLVLTAFSNGTLISLLYIIILTEFYITEKNLIASIAMCVSSIVLFLVTFGISALFQNKELDLGRLLSSAFNDLILLIVHFLVITFAVQLSEKNRELKNAMEDMEKSNEKLRIAYEELKSVTALEERQRIAKDIHDTAGHSITTVIMQTEAAKLAVDSDPEEAKRRIAAANLQAKHALEELRESVHLLSNITETVTLKEQLTGIVHDSTDGTGIVIRTDIDEIELCDAKSRFILNTLKEGISNGLRHGSATAFYFECKIRNERIEFLLSDNGTGMQLAELKEGFGLTGMHKRAESLGGNVYFETEPDEGFEIHLTLPLDGATGVRNEN